MKNVFSYISETLAEAGFIQKEDIAVCKYGIEVFSISVLEVLSVLILSLACGNFMNTMLFFVAFIPLRMYAGGYHADSKLRCYIVLLLVYLALTLFIKHIPESLIVPFAVATVAFTIFMIFRFAPIINEKKKVNEKEILYYKRVSISITLLEAFIILLGMLLSLGSRYIASFALGQFAVSLAMITAFVKTKLIGGETDEKGKKCG